MFTLLLGAFLIYVVVRIAVSHGVVDAEASRLSEERYEAFDQAVERGSLPTLTAPNDPLVE